MKSFEIGKKYFARSVCDSDCKFYIRVLQRSAKFLTFLDSNGNVKKSIIKIDSDGNEFIRPEKYSFAPVFRAYNEEIASGLKDVNGLDIYVDDVIQVTIKPSFKGDNAVVVEGCKVCFENGVCGIYWYDPFEKQDVFTPFSSFNLPAIDLKITQASEVMLHD